jgi:hypothetical protein|tara:strand:+ start:630 stop:1070 length:441 start_codon:yes stop_codon:yes gene_type:complete
MTSFKSNSDNPYDEFIAAIKLVSGEEILSSVMVIADDDDKVILDNPIICEEIRSKGANIPMGYKFEPWMRLTDEDVFIVDMDRIITISEIKDEDVINTYRSIIASGFTREHPDLTKEMGFINTVDKARESFESLYTAEDATKDTQS